MDNQVEISEEINKDNPFRKIIINSLLFILGSIFVFVPFVFKFGPQSEATSIWRVPLAQPFIFLFFLLFVVYYLLIIKNNILKIQESRRVIYFLILLSSYIGLHTFLLCIWGCVSLLLLFFTFPVFLVLLPIVLILSPIIDKFLSFSNKIVLKNKFTDKVVLIYKQIIEKIWNTPIKKILLSSILFVSYMFYMIKELENFKSGYSFYAPISSIIMFLIFFGIYCLIFAKNVLKTKNKKRYIFPFIFVSFYFSIHFFWFLLGGFFTFILCFYTFPIAIILLIFIEIIIISEELSEKNIEKIRHSERSEESH